MFRQCGKQMAGAAKAGILLAGSSNGGTDSAKVAALTGANNEPG